MTVAARLDDASPPAEGIVLLPVARVIPLVPARSRRLLNTCYDDLVTEVVEPMLAAPSLAEAMAVWRRDAPVTHSTSLLLRRTVAHELRRNATLSAQMRGAIAKAAEGFLSLEPFIGSQRTERLRDIGVEIEKVQQRLMDAPERPRVLDEPAERMLELELSATVVDLILLAFLHAQERATQRQPPPWIGDLVDELSREHARYCGLVESLMLVPAPSAFGERVVFINWPDEVAARVAELPPALRREVNARGQDPEVPDHLERGLALLRRVAGVRRIDLEFDHHVSPLQFVLVARKKGTPQDLVVLQSELHRLWRAEVGPRPFRHVLLQIKPRA